MNTESGPDEILVLLNAILRANKTFEEKMRLVEVLEPVIEEAWAQGWTHVKPVRLMTADDLVDISSNA